MHDGIREQERQLKRRKQAIIAEELSMIASDEYRENHLEHMESMEVRLQMCPPEIRLLTFRIARNITRCCLNRGADRDSVVHASVPS